MAQWGILVLILTATQCPSVEAVRRQHAADLLEKTSTGDQMKKDVRHPVVIVGPLLGQTLEVNDRRWFNRCSPLFSNWTMAWLNTGVSALTCAIGLTSDPQLALTFDATTHLTKSPQNVQVRVAEGWSGLSLAGAEVYAGLTARLEAEGWVKDRDILPMPYDWRLSVADWGQGAFPRMRTLIENATAKNGNTVVLTGISMAAPFTQAFLMWAKSTIGPSWAEQHVHAFVPVGGPFNGAVNALSALVGGALLSFSTPQSVFDGAKITCSGCKPALPPSVPGNASSDILSSFFKNVGDFVLNELENDLTELLRGLPSIYWMSTGVDYSTTPPVDKTYVTLTNGPGKEHEKVTASMMPTLFRKIHEDKKAELFEYAMSVGTTEDPGVPTHCVYSYNVRTFSHLSFPAEGDFSEGAAVELGDGDGTVHSDSLSVCDRWASTVKSYKLPGVPHTAMMSVRQVLDVIVSVAKEDNAALDAWTPPSFVDLDLLEGPTNNLTAWQANLIEMLDEKI